MATGFFYKKHDDVGAPTINTGAGEAIAVLDWALDVGTATYWEKVFTGTNKAVYRSKTGIRPYLRIDDSNLEWAEIQMYETMSDVDTGTGVCPDGVNQVANLKLPKGDAQDAGPFQWWIVGDSEYFIACFEADQTYRQYGGANQVRFWGFGEIASYLAVDSYPCVIFGASDTTGGSDYNDLIRCLGGSIYAGFVGGQISDSANYGDPNTALLYWLKTADGITDSSAGYPWQDNSSVMFHRMSAEQLLFYYPTYIQDTAGIVSGSSTDFWGYGNVNATTRGRLPYLYAHNAMRGASNNGPDSQDTVTVGASEFLNIMSYQGGTNLDYQSTKQWLLRITNDEPDRP